jgi:hypothetical protein
VQLIAGINRGAGRSRGGRRRGDRKVLPAQANTYAYVPGPRHRGPSEVGRIRKGDPQSIRVPLQEVRCYAHAQAHPGTGLRTAHFPKS